MLELHPLCTLFPRLAGAEFEALRDDIKANGLRQPIVLHEGMILDGGNRYRACLDAGVDPKFQDFAGGNLVSFVLSANLHRRHLSLGQHAAIVASAQDWARAQSHGGDRSSAHGEHLNDTTETRAGLSGASISTQRRADAVAKANPALAKQVAHGELSLSSAVTKAAPQLSPRTKKPLSPPPPKGDEQSLIQQLREKISDLETDLQATDELNKILAEENKALLQATDPEVLKRVKEARGYTQTLEKRRDELMNENAELKRDVKRLQRALDKQGVKHG